MISIEKRLVELFNTIPSITEGTLKFKPSFYYGNENDFNSFLEQGNNNSTSFYPIIWLETPFESNYTDDFSTEAKISLILASTTSKESSSKEKEESVFKNVLNILYNNVLTALNQSSITQVIEENEIFLRKFYGYDKAIDCLDAIKIDLTIRVNNNNLRKIYY